MNKKVGIGRTLHARFALALLAVIGLTVAPFPAVAEGDCGTAKAHGKAKSENVIAWQQGLSNGESVTLMAVEGEMARLRNEEEGYSYGFIPTIIDADKNEVMIKVFTIAEVEGAGEIVREVEGVTISPGTVQTGTAEPKLNFRLTKIHQASPES